MANQIDVTVPDIGDFSDVEVIEVLVAAGDRVEAEQSLITLESDKATMEIPSPRAGTIGEMKINVGDRVSQGDVIATLTTADAGSDTEMPTAQPETPSETTDRAPDPAPAAEAAGTGPQPVEVPDIGDFKDVEIIEVLVAPGDRVEAEQSLITLESDKATMEIPAPLAGTVSELKVSVGDRVSQGDVIAMISGSPKQDASPSSAADPAPAPAGQHPAEPGPVAVAAARKPGESAPKAPPVVGHKIDGSGPRAHASPAIRRFARELGVDLSRVHGTGPKGRVTKEDVQDFVKHSLSGESQATGGVSTGAGIPPIPAVDFRQFGKIVEQPLGRIKKLSGAHLHRSWLNVPHVTQFDEADVTELEAFRKQQKAQAVEQGFNLTLIPFLMKAVAAAVVRYPQFNSSLSADGESLILKQYLNIGVAVDTPSGLVVPVIRDVDQKGVFDLAEELGHLSEKARNGKLTPAEMQGGCLSISSLGGIGGTQFTPIVNAPEVAIIGVSRAETKPVWDGAAFQPRLIMPFSLSYDHRVIDGAEGVRFTTFLSSVLGDIRRLLL